MESIILAIVTLGTIRPEALNYIAKPKSSAVWACLGVNPLDMPKTLYQASEGKHSQ